MVVEDSRYVHVRTTVRQSSCSSGLSAFREVELTDLPAVHVAEDLERAGEEVERGGDERGGAAPEAARVVVSS